MAKGGERKSKREGERERARYNWKRIHIITIDIEWKKEKTKDS